jgi:hypothetical protein
MELNVSRANFAKGKIHRVLFVPPYWRRNGDYYATVKDFARYDK